MPDRLVCEGDGESISEDGWLRLTYVMGAGDQVERKQFRIGVKNHGLKACFRLGNEIILRSDGHKMIQTLYKDGYESHPSPGTLPEPVQDLEAPLTGCAVEVPYRQRQLNVTKGESVTLDAPNDELLEALFRDACDRLSGRLLGVVRPGIREQYTLRLSHHTLGSAELHWQAKRGRNVKGRGRRRFLVFRRECSTVSTVRGIHSSTIYEQACVFRLSFPAGKRAEIPEFFRRDRNSFLAEIAWFTNKSGTPKSTVGVRRYPIGYDNTSESALTGVGVHFSAPFTSDAERHGASQIDSRNSYIDDACKEALVEITASYLLRRYGARMMELYIADPANPRDEILNDLVRRTLHRRAVPLGAGALRVGKRSERLVLGPRKRSGDGLRRIVMPMFTWEKRSISPHLSRICPSDEDQIDSMVPSEILRCLSEGSCLSSDGFGDLIITFDEEDAIQRLQPRHEATYFPWKNESEWQATLSDPVVARTYLDITYETICNSELTNESDVRQNTYLPDEDSIARPLAEMFSAVNLPPSLGQRNHVSILHPELLDHRLLRRRTWKPKPFRLDAYLNMSQLETASFDTRMSFWTWLRSNWRSVKKETLTRISALPVWPGSDGSLVPLHNLCEPRNTRVSSILGDAIVRPTGDLLKAGLVRTTGRGRLTFRSDPTRGELEVYLRERMAAFSWTRQLTLDECDRFARFEKDLATLVASTRHAKEHVGELSDEYRAGLDREGKLRDPRQLVRAEPALQRLHLLDSHIIDRSDRRLDQVDGWGPMAGPSTRQIVDSLREDGARHDAHVPRLQEYVKQARREGRTLTDVEDVACIPIDGELRPPNEVALRGSRDYWGAWKTVVPVADINPEVQRLYKAIGVVGGTPDSTNGSKGFFEWLSSQNADIIVRHTDQVLRHIGHAYGPRRWTDESPDVPFILVESYDKKFGLATRAEACKRRSRIIIPDFEGLAEAIRRHSGPWPVEMAIVESPKVTEPIAARLHALGMRTLSDYAGEPVRVVGTGRENPTPDIDFKHILDSLQSRTLGKQLQKRLSRLDLDPSLDPLRSNWRERLSGIKNVEIAASVDATYALGRRRFEVSVDGRLDKESGTLRIKLDPDLLSTFFDIIADHIFEQPKKYYGSVLHRAYNMDLNERDPRDYGTEVDPQEDIEIDDVQSQDGVSGVPSATLGVHRVPRPDPARNLPKPGPIPSGEGIIRSVGRRTRGIGRAPSADERSQIDDLRENQYAWHCQACVAELEPTELAPLSSYAANPENRSQIMQAHHCDHVSAGGARHAGNILLLCRYHHLALGDAVTRTDVTRAFGQAGSRRLTFNSYSGVSNSIQGRVVTVHPPQRQNTVSLFFTQEHADHWLQLAAEECLI